MKECLHISNNFFKLLNDTLIYKELIYALFFILQKAVRRQEALRQQVARFVFDVTQEGSARKVITVRSALIIVNKLHMPVTISMYPFGGLG